MPAVQLEAGVREVGAREDGDPEAIHYGECSKL